MSAKKGLPKGKWYTMLLEKLKVIAEGRREMDFKDSYRFRNAISDSDRELTKWVEILMDTKSVPNQYHAIIAEKLRDLVHFGRWPNEVRGKAYSVADLYSGKEEKASV